MSYQYKRISLNTSLRDARIFDEDSWEADAQFLGGLTKPSIEIKNESSESCDEANSNDNTNKTLLVPSSAVTSSVMELQSSNIDSNEKKANFTGKDIKFENIDSPMKQERIDFEAKLKFDEDEKMNSPDVKVRSNLKRKTPLTTKHEVEVDHGNTPTKAKRVLSSLAESKGGKSKKQEKECDAATLSRRQKQIDYGKNTIGYDRYIQAIPKESRARSDPSTPNKYRLHSRRGWDQLIKRWRLKLHKYDPDEAVVNADS